MPLDRKMNITRKPEMIYRLLSLIFLTAWLNVACAADTSVPQFKAIIGRLEKFLQTAPLLYDVQSYPDSHTGLLIYGYRFRVGPLGYDIKKTDSLVTPILGTVSFDVSVDSSKKCGVIQIPRSSDSGAATLEEAQTIASKDECWKQNDVLDNCSMLVTYGYSDSRWELRRLTSEPTGCALLINYASGATISGRLPSDLNKSWRKLNYGLANSTRH